MKLKCVRPIEVLLCLRILTQLTIKAVSIGHGLLQYMKKGKAVNCKSTTKMYNNVFQLRNTYLDMYICKHKEKSKINNQ